MDINARIEVNCERTDGRFDRRTDVLTDGRADRQTEIPTPISNPATAGATTMGKSWVL